MSGVRRLLWSLCLAFPLVAQAGPYEASIAELQVAMARGELTSLALVDYYLDRIERLDRAGPTLNAIARVAADARAQARALDDERRDQGPRGPLHGIPLVVKDNFETRGMATGVGSVLFDGFEPDRDAHAVARLREAGAVILAKTNMHEFAYGITTRGSAFGFTRNPYDRSRNPGGSSGGTAAAVAANLAVAGMGSDSCGSIRNPAAHNNLLGLRGTQGLSSRRGIVPLSHSQDIGGPLARSAEDLAVLLDATVGFDPADPQTAASYRQGLPGFRATLAADALDGARIGVLEQAMMEEPADAAVARVVRRALADMAALGATVTAVRLAELDALLDDPAEGFFVLSYEFRCCGPRRPWGTTSASPKGFAEDGLPLGLELLGPRWSDARLLAFAYALEQVIDRRRSPALPGDPPAAQIDVDR